MIFEGAHTMRKHESEVFFDEATAEAAAILAAVQLTDDDRRRLAELEKGMESGPIHQQLNSTRAELYQISGAGGADQ